MSTKLRAFALLTPVLGLALVASPASAGDEDYSGGPPDQVVAHLTPVPGNGVEGGGTATVEFEDGGMIDAFRLTAYGLLENAPHAAHIHFGEQARNECPGLADDVNGDGRLNTTEGAPAYGGIVASLTTEGDTSPASALAIDRFDTATGGTIDYQRETAISTSQEVAQAIAEGRGVVVVHGVDYDGDGVYGGPVPSDLDPSLPTEATDPALCGVLEDDRGQGGDHADGDDHGDDHEHGDHEH
ncbi:hypothetical protein [Modestobacter versicolor]|uniref:hypothetical protein n=1 Tax=Modestobacter versicolor TaxID=429133 RepID=UPI0034DEF85C